MTSPTPERRRYDPRPDDLAPDHPYYADDPSHPGLCAAARSADRAGERCDRPQDVHDGVDEQTRGAWCEFCGIPLSRQTEPIFYGFPVPAATEVPGEVDWTGWQELGTTSETRPEEV